MALRTLPADHHDDAFVHEAFLYADDDEFVRGTSAFLQEGLAAGEPALVVVAQRKIDMLRESLGPAADAVMFADMADIGANPARIIPAWDEFVRSHVGDVRLRGIGEPIFPGRSTDEVRECQLHESLLNVAFEDGRPWWLVCPYNTAVLPADVIEEAHRSHPFVGGRANGLYRGVGAVSLLDDPLPAPPPTRREISFGAGPVRDLRHAVADACEDFGLRPERAHDLMLAVSELASNSVKHGGGHGVLRIWDTGDTVVCEVADEGRLADPMVGRMRPVLDEHSGRGVWLVHNVCDLVQIRTSDAGTVVRVHVRR